MRLLIAIAMTALLWASAASAVDLTGRSVVLRYDAVTDDKYADRIPGMGMNVYFGTDGTRFLYLEEQGGVAIPAGKNSGRQYDASRKSTFSFEIGLTGSKLTLKEALRYDDGGKNDTAYQVRLAEDGKCTLTSVKINQDPGLRWRTDELSCKIVDGNVGGRY